MGGKQKMPKIAKVVCMHLLQKLLYVHKCFKASEKLLKIFIALCHCLHE